MNFVRKNLQIDKTTYFSSIKISNNFDKVKLYTSFINKYISHLAI